jgi:hypothetical protein
MAVNAASPATAQSNGADGQGFDSGQGVGAAPDQANGLYDLNDAPEELRPWLTQELKKVEANVTKKFQEAADFRKRWEPYEGVQGLDQIAPEELAELVNFRNTILSDESGQALRNWMAQVQQELGGPILDEESWYQAGIDNGWIDSEDGEGGQADGQIDPQTIAQQVIEMLRPELEPVKQFMGQTEQQQAVAEIQAQNEATMRELGLDPQSEEGQAVLSLAYQYVGDEDYIQRAYEDYQRITGKAVGDSADRDAAKPGGALNGGVPDTSPEQFDGLTDPRLKEAALARFRG